MAAFDDIVSQPQGAVAGDRATLGNGPVAAASDAVATVPEPKRMSYVEMFQKMNPFRPESDDDRAKRQRRERGQAVLAAVGDGISALSNLWFTSRYAPNAYRASGGGAAATRRRWDELRKEREANERAYLDGYMRAAAMDDQRERDDWNRDHTVERERIADERYNEKAAQDRRLAELNEQLRRNEITISEHRAEQERIKSLYADENEKLDQEYRRAGIQQRRAAAGASNAAAGASQAKADYYRDGGGRSRPTLQLEKELMKFDDPKDYDRTVMRLAADYGVPTVTEEVVERDYHGNPRKTRPHYRPVKDIAADIERRAAGLPIDSDEEGKGKGYGDGNNNSNNEKGKGYGS